MNELNVRTDTGQLWRVCYLDQIDSTELSLVKDEKNREYVSGKASFYKQEYDYFLQKKQQGILTVFYRYKYLDYWIEGKISLVGEWNYAAKYCSLEFSSNDQYDEFEKLLDVEHDRLLLSTLPFTFDSELHSEYGTLGLDSEGEIYDTYSNCGSVTPDTYDPNINYSASNNLGSGAFAGSLDVFVFLSGSIYASLQDNNLGNNPATSPLFWEEISDLYIYSQERSVFDFHENAEYNENGNYYYRPYCTANTYNESITGFKISTAFETLLDGTSFSLSSNWLNYAENINPDYVNLYLANSDIPEKVTISELIDLVCVLFNCEYRLENYQLTFKHWSEIIKDYSGYSVNEHYYLNRTDINLFKQQKIDEVFEHRLNFTKSIFGTHNDSVLLYENDYVESRTVKGSFDVDFVYCYNKKGKSCPVTLSDSTNEINYDSVNDIYNPDFIPSILHENFYLQGREFNSGELNGVYKELVKKYNEDTDFEAKGALRLNYFDFTEKILLLQGIYGRWKKVEYSINDNTYKLTASIQ